jgi:hypothetical protein
MIPMQERNLRQRKRIRKAELLKHVAYISDKHGIASAGTRFCHLVLPSRPAAHGR